MIGEEVAALVDEHLPEGDSEFWDLAALVRAVRQMNPLLPEEITEESLEGRSRDEIEDELYEKVEQAYEVREQAIGAERMRFVERRMMLGAIDRQWVDYLTAMDALRQSITLQAYAQRDPLVEFKRRSFDMFDELKDNITHDIVYQIIPASFEYEAYLQRIEEEQKQRLAAAQRAGTAEANEQARRSRTVRHEVKMPGRNEQCPCGSGKKFKQCHLGREDEIIPILLSGGSAPSVSVQLATGGTQASVSNSARSENATATGSSQSGDQPDGDGKQQPAPAQQEKKEKAPQTQATPRGRSAPPAPGAQQGGGKKKKQKQKSAERGKQPARKR
jgi:preprotein translocase subunit SecA